MAAPLSQPGILAPYLPVGRSVAYRGTVVPPAQQAPWIMNR
jgi:hypothetical protein